MSNGRPDATASTQERAARAMKTAQLGTVTGVLVFVGGGLGTILTAVTSFGVNSGAVDLARRNHHTALTWAAALAAGGLLCGATYTIGGRWKNRRVVEVVRREGV